LEEEEDDGDGLNLEMDHEKSDLVFVSDIREDENIYSPFFKFFD